MTDRKIPVSITEQQVERQLEIEQNAKTRAIARSRLAVKEALDKGRASDLLPVQRLISAAFGSVAQSIDEIKNTKVTGVGGKFRVFIRKVDTDVLATAALTYVMDAICHEHRTNSTAQALMAGLGRIVQAEILNKQLETVAPAYINRVHEYLKERQTRSASHILRTLRASADAVQLQHEPWSNTDCISVGKLVMQAVYDTGLFQWESGTAQMKYLLPSEQLEKVLVDVVTHASMMLIAPPMIVPPQDHRTMFDGGYLTDFGARQTYKNSHITNAERRRVADEFYKADKLKAVLNKIQNVPYRVNHAVYDFVMAARAQGVGVGMPSTVAKPKPEWRLEGVPKEQYTEREAEDFDQWKSQMRHWYGEDRKRISKLRGVAMTLELCREYHDEPQLFFPSCVDWRYRFYFKSALDPQGNDLQKALLELARGKALGERGLFWLKVNVATCFGFDKATFEKRAEWADTHFAEIERVATDPFNTDSFEQADSPWCFLAGCIDLVNAVNSGNPAEYVSHLPVAMDATNSGGQHFSAMLRDEIGGRMTNLFWEGQDEKADLYMDVKQRTDSKVVVRLREGNPDDIVQAHFWRKNEITRTMTKRPTMTYFYSATIRSCSDYILLGAVDEGYESLEDFSLFKLSGWLAPIMRDSIDAAMPAAAAAMKFIQDVTRTIPLEKHLEWHTPLGGLVINRYTTTTEHRVTIRSMGLSKVVAYNKSYDMNNRRKAVAGAAPNGIHSQDSTHLGMVVLNFDGDIVPIHDSVATHAADVDEMHRVLREQFYKLYTEYDFLETLREAAEKAGGDTSEIATPEHGTLDLRRVMDSPFFFC